MEISREPGRIVINGKEFTVDVVIYKDSVFERGSSDTLSSSEMEEILNKIGEKPKVVIIGTGSDASLAIEDDVVTKLKGSGIRVVIQLTDEAIETYKELKSMGVEPLLIIHVT